MAWIFLVIFLNNTDMEKLHIRSDKADATLLLGLPVGYLKEMCRVHGIKVSGRREINYVEAIMTAPKEKAFDIIIDTTVIGTPPTEPDPFPRIEVLYGKRMGGSQTKTRSLLYNRTTQCIDCLSRYADTSVGAYIDVLEGNQFYATDYSSVGGGFIGSLHHSNGKSYAFPAHANHFAVSEKDGTLSKFMPSQNPRQLRGGCEVAEGLILCPRFKKDRTLYSLEPDTGYQAAVPYSNIDLFGEQNTGSHWHWGAVSDRHSAFILPWDSRYVGFYDGDLNSDPLMFLPDLIVGRKGDTTWRALYSHGAYDPETKTACSIGRNSEHVLVCYFYTREIEQIPFPDDLIAALNGAEPCFGQEFGPDGWLYGAPFGAPILIRFNPKTKEIQWKFIEELTEGDINLHPNGKGNGWFTEVLRVDDSIYMGAGGSDAFARLVF